MKMAENFSVENKVMLEPLVGRVAKVIVDGETVTVRVVSVGVKSCEVKVIPDGTLE